MVKSVSVFLFFSGFLAAQTCAPMNSLAATGSAAGAWSEASCRLSDATPFQDFSLVLPARGRLELALVAAAPESVIYLRDSEGRKLASGAAFQGMFEMGAYTVRAAGSSGDFTLTSSFTPEPGAMCRAFPPAGVNQTVSGALGETSCRLPDGTPFDGWQIRPPGSGTIDITVTPDGVDPFIIVRDEDGRALVSQQGSSASVSVHAGEAYTVLINAPSARAYRAAFAFQAAEGDPCQRQKLVTASGDLTGRLSAPACSYMAAGTDAAALYHFYEIEVTEPGLMEFQVASAAFAPLLVLRDAAGRVVSADAQGGGPARPVIRQQTSRGTYYLLIAADAGRPGGDYTVKYVFRPGLPETCPMVALDAGRTAQGTLSAAASCRTADGLADIYKIVLPADGHLEIAAASQDFDTFLVLRDERDNLLAFDDDSATGTNSLLTADLPRGAYTLVVSSLGLPGAYLVQQQFTARALPGCRSAALPPNSAYVGFLGGNSCRGADGQPADTYDFTLPADGQIAAVMLSRDVDGYLLLENLSGQVVRRDDNSFGGSDPLFTQYLPAGSYRLTARGSAAANQAGYYRVDLLYASGDRPAGCSPVRGINPGDSVQASLGYTSCEYAGDTFADIYSLELSEDTPLEFRLDSADFDAVLIVLDAKGNVLDGDDDSGPTRNPLLRRSLPAGRYYVVAKPYQGYDSSGKYQLSLRRTEM